MTVRIGHSPSGVHVQISDEDEFFPPAHLYHRGKYTKYKVTFYKDHYILTPSPDRQGYACTQLPNGTFKMVLNYVSIEEPFSDSLDVLYFRMQTPERTVFNKHGKVLIYPDFPAAKTLVRTAAELRAGAAAPVGKPQKVDLGKIRGHTAEEARQDWIPGIKDNLKVFPDPRVPTVTKTVKSTYRLELKQEALIEAVQSLDRTLHIPHDARLWVQIPSGGDYSGEPLGIEGDRTLNVSWEQSE